jgi:hypothetical protein
MEQEDTILNHGNQGEKETCNTFSLEEAKRVGHIKLASRQGIMRY